MTIFGKLAAAGAVSAVVALSATASHASITEYFTEASFLAAAGATELEDFNSFTLNPDLTITSLEGFPTGSVWHDRVVLNDHSDLYSFSHDITAFGAFWDETPGGFGQGLRFTLNLVGGGQASPASQLDGYAGEFYGFISSQKFDSVIVSAGFSPGVAETHTLDNLRYSAGTPEPGAWALMLVGFAGLGAAVRSRRAVTAA
jgi:hypothetical protein